MIGTWKGMDKVKSKHLFYTEYNNTVGLIWGKKSVKKGGGWGGEGNRQIVWIKLSGGINGGHGAFPTQTEALERMRTPVRHISYGIRHTALSRTYAIVAYVRHNNNWRWFPCIWYSKTSPLTRIVSALDEPPVCMEPAYYSPISLIQNIWM